jgi:hypothetical protein
MATYGRTTQANASADLVWKIWSDVRTWPGWNPDVLAVSIDGPFATGTTGKMTTKAGGSHAITLQAVEPGRSFRLETSPVPLGRFAFTCEVRTTTPGVSAISQSVTIHGPLGALYSAMMGRRIAEGFVPILDGLKAAVESQDPA